MRSMTDTDSIANEIKKLIYQYFELKKFQHKYKIPLAVPTFDSEDIWEAVESLLSSNLTMGKKVANFETLWAQYLNIKHSILINSGHSANSLALAILSNPSLSNRIQPGDEVITTPVTFPSSVYPIIQIGAIPVFVDVDLDTLNINPEKIEDAITEKTKAIFPVHFMGNPCEMDIITEITSTRNLFLIEDVCESHGAEFKGKKAGTFGDIGTFSFFFSHHICTIEGGSLVTNNEEYDEICRTLRSYGWIRNLREKEKIASEYKHIDPRHLYVNIGFNFKPTEITAALGMHQIKKIEDIIKHKRDNASYLIKNLQEFEEFVILPEEREGTRHTWLGFPLLVRPGSPFDKFDMMNFLENHGIETRQLEAGNMLQQPSIKYYRHKIVGDTRNAEIIMHGGFFFGNYHTMKKEDLDYIINILSDFFKNNT